MPVYAKALGFSSYVVGVIYTVLPLIGMFLKPTFGAIADRFKWHKGVLVGWVFLTMVGFCCTWFIPAIDSAIVSQQFISACYGCDTVGLRIKTDTAGDDGGITDAETFKQWYFWVFLFLLILAWGGMSVVNTLGDTVCIEICEDSSLFGQQRLWGSVSWGLFAMLAGLIIDEVSEEGKDKNYTPVFVFVLVTLILDIILCSRLKCSIPAKSESIARDTWQVLLKPRNAYFWLCCILFGMSLGVIHFLFWLLEDLASAQGPSVTSRIKTLEGLAAGVQTFLGETPAFFFGGWVVSKIGRGRSVSLVFLVIAVRCVIYSQLVNPWWCLPVEILQNNYGLFYSTMTSYAKKIAPTGTEATIQGICSAGLEAGVAIGSYLAGMLYDLYGGSKMFLICGIAFAVLTLINETVEVIFRISDRKRLNVLNRA